MENTIKKSLYNNIVDLTTSTIVVGVSGGKDSMALLNCLINIQKECAMTLIVAHINHGVRADAWKDQKLVEAFTKEKNLKFSTINVNMEREAKLRGLTAEEAGRELRYGFFNKLIEGIPNSYIAVAHNKNDQAETVFMRILRGTGLEGLAAMKEKSGNILRPMLTVSREEIEEYISVNNIEFADDYTNHESVYARNKVRNEVFPYLEKQFNVNVIESLFKLSELTRENNEIIKELVKEKLALATKKTDPITLSISELRLNSSEINKLVIREALRASNEKGLYGITLKHIERVLALLNGQTGKAVPIIRGLIVCTSYDDLIFTAKEQLEIKPIKAKTLKIGLNELDETHALEIEEARAFCEDNDCFLIEEKYLNSKLIARSRLNGDRIKLANGDTKKLKDFLIDKKVPREVRDKLVVLEYDGEIIWIIGYYKNYRYSSNKVQDNIIKINYTRRKE